MRERYNRAELKKTSFVRGSASTAGSRTSNTTSSKRVAGSLGSSCSHEGPGKDGWCGGTRPMNTSPAGLPTRITSRHTSGKRRALPARGEQGAVTTHPTCSQAGERSSDSLSRMLLIVGVLWPGCRIRTEPGRSRCWSTRHLRARRCDQHGRLCPRAFSRTSDTGSGWPLRADYRQVS